MVVRIEVGFKSHVIDAQGEKIARRIRDHLGLPVDSVRTVEVYTLEGDFTNEELEEIARGPLSDPIIQEYRIGQPLACQFDWLIEVGYRPGVTDNVGKTAKEAILLLLARDKDEQLNVYTSRQYVITGTLTKKEAESIASNLLANDLIEHYRIVSFKDWDCKQGLSPYVPRVMEHNEPHTEKIDLNVEDEELISISESRILALNIEEMRAIRTYLKDKHVIEARKKVGLDHRITDVELECIAQTWSEHCKHKIFNAQIRYEDDQKKVMTIDSLFETFIKKATQKVREAKGKDDICLSVFSDNAGVIKFTEDYNLVFKVETHNSPSALDPYGGALTGIVGVNRDPFGTGKGAKLIFNTDVFCFARPDYDQPLPPRILHPRRILEGVREGVEHGGNKSGIPTVNGCIVFDDRYLGKPLVYCGTGGIMPSTIKGEASHKKEIRPGDLIVMTGGRIGKDGIHGATFSSQELHEGSPVTAVQIGDPITQKKMIDFLLVARDRGLYRTLTDNGAGGLSSSVGETARLSGGCEMDLKRAPLKYQGLNPWEILVSESQERMTVAVPPEKISDFLELARKMDVEATVLGQYTDTGMFHVRYGDETVAFLHLDFLHEGLPQMKLSARWSPPRRDETPPPPYPAHMGNALKAMLGRLNICSKEWVVRQYDHEVQGGSVVKPLTGAENDGPSDAAVIRPLLDSFVGVVVANGICPRYGDIDTYHMAACAIDEAVRNAIAVGGSLDHLAGLDNFCWCDPVASEKNPDGEYKLAQLVRANMALYDITTAYGIPCISGKDSMKNDYAIGNIKISIPPTLLFSVIGRIDDVRKAVTMDAKRPGDLVYVLGVTKREMGGSEWYAMHGLIGHSVPHVEPEEAKRLYQALSLAIRRGLIASAHDCSDGGLGCALAEVAMAGGWGLEIDLRQVPQKGIDRDDELLFSESQSRFVVTVSPHHQKDFEDTIAGLPWGLVGEVVNRTCLTVIGLSGEIIMDEDIYALKAAWKAPLNF
ncbi:MAG: phosphoribosylformylglycinamidine synthase subunit PurS [Syntrophales bacterium]|nr:phosphoribosylformylglycinamidine synthase subunit PurS [Syntrophales bacterium]